MTSKPEHKALAGLLAGALVWGLIWYPYRVLESLGLGGVMATFATYSVALGGLSLLSRSAWKTLRPTPVLFGIALAAGACNLAYVLAMLEGEVMRVLLLFYLAPLWTVLLARFLLGERLTRSGAIVLALSLSGALTMLWRPGQGIPLPACAAEWLGLGSGFGFALSNVLSRRAAHLSEETRSLAMFLGVVLLGGVLLLPDPSRVSVRPDHLTEVIAMVLLTGSVLLAVTLAVQYGLAHTPANQAAVILLCELVVAAFGSWFLAGEAMSAREWLGGIMIASASLLSGRCGE